ncbi:MAG: DUF2914 domain-containing protein [Thiotrichaceae bacterium]
MLRTATFYSFISMVALGASLNVSADDLIISYPANAALAPPTPVVPAAPRPSTPPPPVSVKPNVPAQVSRAQFTTGLSNREPINNVTQVNAGQTVYYFTELMGLQGHTITHKWQRNGVFQLGLQFPVGAERWRVHSSKTIAPNLTGIWTVSVQNDDGQILRQDTLQVLPALASAPTPPSATPVNPPVIPAPSQPLTPIPAGIQKAAEDKKLLGSTPSTSATNTTSNTQSTNVSNSPQSEANKTTTNLDTAAKDHASWDKPSTDSTTKPMWETLNR